MNNILNIFKPSQPLPTNLIQSLALVPDRPSLTYNSGELVTGHCIISVNGTLDISQIEIKLSGKAKVELPVTNSQSSSTNHHNQNQHQHVGGQHHAGQQQVINTWLFFDSRGLIFVYSCGIKVVKKDCSILKLLYNPATGKSVCTITFTELQIFLFWL